MDTAVRCLQDRHGMFSNSVRRVSRNTKNRHSTFFRGNKIHIVKSGATEEDQFYSTLIEDLYNISATLIIYKDTNRIKSFGKLS